MEYLEYSGENWVLIENYFLKRIALLRNILIILNKYILMRNILKILNKIKFHLDHLQKFIISNPKLNFCAEYLEILRKLISRINLLCRISIEFHLKILNKFVISYRIS